MGNNVSQAPASSVIFHAEDGVTGYPGCIIGIEANTRV
jgi:hypothetical protein